MRAEGTFDRRNRVSHHSVTARIGRAGGSACQSRIPARRFLLMELYLLRHGIAEDRSCDRSRCRPRS